jgi:hypothetical protein
MWEESLLLSASALREASAGCDTSHAHMGATRRDYLAQVGTSDSRSEWRKSLHQGLDECPTLLGLQEMDLEVHKVIVAEELECSLRHLDRSHLPIEMYRAHARANKIAGD